MKWKSCCPLFLLVALLCWSCLGMAEDAHLRIPIPSRSHATPVQKLNREAVSELSKQHYDRARSLLYRAYLIDPDDPFTLNNLGYLSELTGDIERAHQYYDLAEKHTTNAMVDKSTVKDIEGEPISRVVAGMGDRDMQVNRLNMEALRYLNQDRPQEADMMLQRALQLDPRNAFTLNNLGFAKETEGELEAAEHLYEQAGSLNSNQPVLVTARKDWRGKPVSKVARQNAKDVRKLIKKEQDVTAQVARYNLRGVSALNRNDRAAARQYFMKAYKLDPRDAFTLNNMGYLSELDGDRETAQDFYRQAQRAGRVNDRVTYSTRLDMQGKKLLWVAEINDTSVDSRIEQLAEARRRRGGAIRLKRRDNTPVVEPENPPVAAPSQQSPSGAPPAASAFPSGGGTQIQAEPSAGQAVPGAPPAEQVPPAGTTPATTLPPADTPTMEPQPAPSSATQPSNVPPSTAAPAMSPTSAPPPQPAPGSATLPAQSSSVPPAGSTPAGSTPPPNSPPQ